MSNQVFATKEEAHLAASEIVSGYWKSTITEMRSLFRTLSSGEEADFIEEFIEKVETRIGKDLVGDTRTFMRAEIREYFGRSD